MKSLHIGFVVDDLVESKHYDDRVKFMSEEEMIGSGSSFVQYSEQTDAVLALESGVQGLNMIFIDQ